MPRKHMIVAIKPADDTFSFGSFIAGQGGPISIERLEEHGWVVDQIVPGFSWQESYQPPLAVFTRDVPGKTAPLGMDRELLDILLTCLGLLIAYPALSESDSLQRRIEKYLKDSYREMRNDTNANA